LPPDTCEYFLDILEGLDFDNQSVLLLKNLFIPLLLMGTGRFEEARARSAAIIREWEHKDTPLSLYLLYTAYSNLAYIDTYTCTVTHKYDFVKHLKKAVEYYSLTSMPPVKVEGAFGVADLRSYACLVGEGADLPELGQFLETAREAAVYISETYHYMYHGYDDLVACELAFFRNRPAAAKNFAHNAILKAREKKQYSIEMMAQFYLLRIALKEGNYPLVKEILNLFDRHLNNAAFGNRQLLHDLFTGFFYVQTGLPEKVAPWLIMDEKEKNTSEIHIPIGELIVGIKYHVACQNYDQALVILNNSYPREPQERFLFGELTLALLGASARFKSGDIVGAAAEFKKAYRLSFNGELETPFIELGKNLHPLAEAVLKQKDGVIPEQWLKTVGRKASIYAKQSVFVMNSFKREQNMEEPIQLSGREQEVLTDLYHGLTRDEIAENRHLSINTVKKILHSIYMKLEANNSADAVRTAIEKKLVK
jgi:LuxR family maltose regulon positive regulatory protein